jgi:hypothetical protein
VSRAFWTVSLFASVLSGAAFAQELTIPEVAYPPIAAVSATPEGFAPKDWPIEFKSTGDLNGDGADDLVLVLRDTDPHNILDNAGFGPDRFNTNPRLLVVALRRPQGGYERVLADHTLITRATEPNLDDVLEDKSSVESHRGALRVTLHLFASAGGWTMGSMTYSFRLQQGSFVLIGYDSSMVQRNSGQTEDISINYLTRKRKDATGSIENDRQNVRWKTLPPAPLLTLEQVGDGMEFDPDQSPS